LCRFFPIPAAALWTEPFKTSFSQPVPRRVLEAAPDNLSTLMMISLAVARNGDTQRAIAYWEQAIDVAKKRGMPDMEKMCRHRIAQYRKANRQ
jgi:cytochrome c-type biogenesis protein CcmH/NrfG